MHVLTPRPDRSCGRRVRCRRSLHRYRGRFGAFMGVIWPFKALLKPVLRLMTLRSSAGTPSAMTKTRPLTDIESFKGGKRRLLSAPNCFCSPPQASRRGLNGSFGGDQGHFWLPTARSTPEIDPRTPFFDASGGTWRPERPFLPPYTPLLG